MRVSLLTPPSPPSPPPSPPPSLSLSPFFILPLLLLLLPPLLPPLPPLFPLPLTQVLLPEHVADAGLEFRVNFTTGVNEAKVSTLP